MTEDNQQPKQPIQIQVSEAQKTGVYSNAVSVTIGRNEMILDFGYVIPNVQPVTIQVVSRVNMSYEQAKNFLSTLQNAVLDYEKKLKIKN